MAELEQAQKLAVALKAISRKADVIRMQAAQPPQNPTVKRQAGEIMTLAELASEWV